MTCSSLTAESWDSDLLWLLIWPDIFFQFTEIIWHRDHWVPLRFFTLTDCSVDNNTINSNKVTSTGIASQYVWHIQGPIVQFYFQTNQLPIRSTPFWALLCALSRERETWSINTILARSLVSVLLLGLAKEWQKLGGQMKSKTAVMKRSLNFIKIFSSVFHYFFFNSKASQDESRTLFCTLKGLLIKEKL